MAKLATSSSQVRPTVDDPIAVGVAGEAIESGQAVAYMHDLDKWLLATAQCDEQYAGSDGYGIALCRSRAYGQPIVVALPGHRVTLGADAAPVAGRVYFLGAESGGLFLASDLISADRVLALCIGIGGDKVRIIGGAYDVGALLA